MVTRAAEVANSQSAGMPKERDIESSQVRLCTQFSCRRQESQASQPQHKGRKHQSHSELRSIHDDSQLRLMAEPTTTPQASSSAPTASSSSDRGKSSSRGGRSRGRGRGKGRGGSQPKPPPTQGQENQGPQLPGASARRGSAARGSRRGKFGSRVTADNAHAQPSAHAHVDLQAAAQVAALPVDASLQARLTHSLLLGDRECSICVSSISPKESIYSCPTCFAIDHLACVKDWASRSVHDLRERQKLQPNLLVQWRCPSCNTASPPKDLPTTYRCFCGRQRSPKPRPGQTPHSCGQSCARSRPCGHACNLFCHPGPCEPCSVAVTTSCWCGKLVKDLRCSDVQAQRTCGQVCGKKLNCGLHVCPDVCHEGECNSCGLQRDKICFCGQTSVEETCFQPQHPPQDRLTCFGNATESWQGECACARDCQRLMDCGRHLCLKPCHPHGSDTPDHCPLSPDVLLRCPCGVSPQPTRQSCADPIFTCASTCNAPLPCGHACMSKCHTDAHPPCTQRITVLCRCGTVKQELPCHEASAPDFVFTCKRSCKALRNCGKHECARVCCPLAFQEGLLGGKRGKKIALADLQAIEAQDEEGVHACSLPCAKLLSCGRHHCSRPDHRGPCGPCLASEFSEVSCHCGGTILLPPVPCGTALNCTLPCARPAPVCGHPKAPHACHEDDVGCPPCTFLSDRPCACDKHLLVKNVRCSMPAERISCGTQCGRLLACGAHRCKAVCHSGSCPPCSQRCGKLKKLCGHPHEAACHAPSACSLSVPCPTPVDVTCACGNYRQRALCGSCTARPETAANAFLPCIDACAVKKRNAALADALGIGSDVPKAGRLAALYDEPTLAFYEQAPNWCEQIEATLHGMLRSNKPSHLFQPMRQEQRHVVKSLATAFNMKAESLDVEPRRSVHVVRIPESAAPINSLSDSFVPRPKSTIALASTKSASEATVATPPLQRWNALLLTAVFGHHQSSLLDVLGPVLSFPFDLRWVGEEDVLLVPTFPSGQSDANIESALRSAKFALQSVPDIRAQEVSGCHVEGEDVITWKESKPEKLNVATAWTRPRQAASATPAPKPADFPQSRWTTLGHVRGNGLSPPASSTPPTSQVGKPASPVLDDWEQEA